MSSSPSPTTPSPTSPDASNLVVAKPRPRVETLLAGGAFASMVSAIVIALIFSGILSGPRAVFDQDKYHLPTIQRFAADWPQVDLTNYRSATTPGYHLALAAIAKYVDGDPILLRVVGSFFLCFLLTTLVRNLAYRTGPAQAVTLLAPVPCSLYILSSGIWLLPDNAAWWSLALLLSLCWWWVPTTRVMVLASMCLLVLVVMRQIHLWAASTIWLAAWLGATSSVLPTVGDSFRSRLRRTAIAVLLTAPSFALVAWFMQKWGGPVPPLFQANAFDPVFNATSGNVTGGNPATPAFLLTVFATFGVFYGGYWWAGIVRLVRGQRCVWAPVLIGAGLGLAAALATATSWNDQAGRFSGFWTIAAKLPTFADRSLYVTVGAPAGGALVGLLWAMLPRRDGWMLIGTLVPFTLAQSASFFCWQRYFEGYLYFVLIFAASRVVEVEAIRLSRASNGDEATARQAPPSVPGFVRVARLVGPVVLALGMAGAAYVELR